MLFCLKISEKIFIKLNLISVVLGVNYAITVIKDADRAFELVVACEWLAFERRRDLAGACSFNISHKRGRIFRIGVKNLLQV
jgi:hypothetical protein